MQKSYGLARFVAIALLVFAGLILLFGLIGAFTASTRGFGDGWSEGTKAVVILPILGATCSSAFFLFLLGGILLLLVDTSRNLSEVRLNPPPKVVVQEALPAAAAVAVEPAAQAVEAVVEAPVVAAEAVVEEAAAVVEEVTSEVEVKAPKPRKAPKPKPVEAAAAAAVTAAVVAEAKEKPAKPKKAAKAQPLPGAAEAEIVAAELAATRATTVDLDAGAAKPPRISVKLAEVAKIGEANAAALSAFGIRSSGSLLMRGATRKGREEIAAGINVSPKLVLEWVNHVDLMRIRGIGEEYAQLLEASGVDTVPEMAQRNPDNLLVKLLQMNDQLGLVRQTPTLAQVQKWVESAKALPRMITY